MKMPRHLPTGAGEATWNVLGAHAAAEGPPSSTRLREALGPDAVLKRCFPL